MKGLLSLNRQPRGCNSDNCVSRNILDIPSFGRFQRQINLLFATLGITVEFQADPPEAVGMKWIFPSESKLAEFLPKQQKHPCEVEHLVSCPVKR